MEEWFSSTNSQVKIGVFRELGKKSLPFLTEKLNGQFPDRERACMLIGEVCQRSQVENSDIETKIRNILMTGSQSEQTAAYAVIRRLDLKVPDSEITIAASTSPSVRASEEEFISQPKLARLYSMTNSVDCSFVAKLLNDQYPEVQMLTLAWMGTKTHDNLCNEKIVPALASLMKNTKDVSALSAALGYMSSSPQRMRENVIPVCSFLETATNSELEMECLGLLAALGNRDPLPAEARHSLESLLSRSNLDSNIRDEAKNLLNYGFVAQSSSNRQN
jgi:hypothetical protein